MTPADSPAPMSWAQQILGAVPTTDIILYLLQDGVANGATYALMGIAIVLLFSVTRIIFLPQGEFVSLAAFSFVAFQRGDVPGTIYLIWLLASVAMAAALVSGLRERRLGASIVEQVKHVIPPVAVSLLVLIASGYKLPLLAQVCMAIALVTPLGPLLYRVVYEPVQHASVLLLFIISVALHFVLVGISLYYFGPEGVRSVAFGGTDVSFAGQVIPAQTVVIVSTIAVLIAALYFVSRFTFYGKVMVAASISARGAQLVGISSAYTGRVAFAGAAFIGSVAGVLIAPVVTVSYDTGFMLGLKGFVGAIIGGFASYPAAAIGALAVGVVESFSAFYWSSLKEIIVFALIIPVLAVRSSAAHGGEDASDMTAAPDGQEEGATGGRKHNPWLPYILIATAVLILIALPLILSQYSIVLLAYVGLAAMAVLGLVLLTGIAGLTSFGQAAFVGLGAYVTGVLTVVYGVSPWLTLPAVIVSVAIVSFGAAAVTVKLSGHYLPLSTLAVGATFYYLFGSISLTGAQSGLSGIPRLAIGHLDMGGPTAMYAIIWGAVLLQLYGMQNLLYSREGRGIRALRTVPDMARSMGVDVVRARTIVFVLASTFAGISGWLYAHFQRFINPTPFSIAHGIELLFMAVIGGAGSLVGAILGSGIVVIAREWLQEALPRLLGVSGSFDVVVLSIAAIFMLQYAPAGLWPWLQRTLRIAASTDRSHFSPFADILKPLEKRPQPQTGEAILVVNGVVKRFGSLVATNSVGFEINAGTIVGLIGPNGAGKSTMFNLISGVLRPDAGSIVFRGAAIERQSPIRIVRNGLARTFQHVKIDADMTVLENAAIGAHVRGGSGIFRSALRLDRKEEQRILQEAMTQLDRVGLGQFAQQRAGGLALGQQRLLEVARALCSDPVMILLDEPAAGLRLLEKDALATLLKQLRREGMTVFLVEHDMDFVMKMADRIIVMNYGEKLTEGTPQQIQCSQQVIDAYLGSEA
jgi:branched-chain amino acid transport system ATP-binding protein